ncbi:hypothetical protein EV356DRAFT_502983 [Viridothelium virens]|uniref:Nucleotidylyl transferase n=1 Tax=Viridothelium virens TaxID=1048519 RepID=A0A6A6H6Y6_VIRVR|nr:hypothetical protein EV356DRAFT_502983 [Viridothelium virens]
MPSRLSRLRSQVPDLTSAFHTFQSSSSSFSILRTINAPNPTSVPKTLFILDSSFNPPSRAHLELATSVFKEAKERNGGQPKYTRPWRLLLLFSTHNADKAPSAATFEQRLALMCILAEDIIESLRNPNLTTSSSPTPVNPRQAAPDSSDPVPVDLPIDIGVTTQPYYTDKSSAIASVSSSASTSASSSSTPYPAPPNHPQHIHLCGFDTLTRILNPKYYPTFTPPLSALDPYFAAGHGFRVTQRPDDDYGTAEHQDQFLFDLAGGAMRGVGGKEEWARQIEMVGGEEGVGISSTRVRRAAKKGDWAEVEGLCTRGVAGWVREEGLYEGDDRGAKMA